VIVKHENTDLDPSYLSTYYGLMMKVAAVIFDLDGTLTKPYLDFNRIREEIGSVQGPLLEAMEKMTPKDRRRAEDILHRHEREAAENSELNPGVWELLRELKKQDRRLGIVTRNRRGSVQRVCQIHDLVFEGITCREDGPAKPDPFAVLHVCEQLNVAPEESMVVGDYLFDLQSARRAGAKCVLYRSQDHSWGHEEEADYVIDHFNELLTLIADIENGKR